MKIKICLFIGAVFTLFFSHQFALANKLNAVCSTDSVDINKHDSIYKVAIDDKEFFLISALEKPIIPVCENFPANKCQYNVDSFFCSSQNIAAMDVRCDVWFEKVKDGYMTLSFKYLDNSLNEEAVKLICKEI